MERAFVYVDDSANGRLAAALAGMFAARQQVLTTVLEPSVRDDDKARGRERLAAAFNTVLRNMPEPSQALAVPAPSVEQLVQARTASDVEAVSKEVTKGYSIAFVGIDQPTSSTTPRFEEPLQSLSASFDGPIGIVINGGQFGLSIDAPIDILVPTGGSPDARLATEIALALAGASRGTLTALHVFDPREDTLMLRGRARRLGMSVLVDARRLGRRGGVPVKGLTATNSRPETVIQRIARRGRYDLVVLGTALRRGDVKYLGPRTLAMVQSLGVPVLLIAR
jgi:nucleotide-binding universal stress UspA family protein